MERGFTSAVASNDSHDRRVAGRQSAPARSAAIAPRCHPSFFDRAALESTLSIRTARMQEAEAFLEQVEAKVDNQIAAVERTNALFNSTARGSIWYVNRLALKMPPTPCGC